MGMIALDAARTKVVPADSIEARWLVNEGEASDFIRHAKKHPKMQALMREQQAEREKSQKLAAQQAALEAAAREARLKQLGYA